MGAAVIAIEEVEMMRLRCDAIAGLVPESSQLLRALCGTLAHQAALLQTTGVLLDLLAEGAGAEVRAACRESEEVCVEIMAHLRASVDVVERAVLDGGA